MIRGLVMAVLLVGCSGATATPASAPPATPEPTLNTLTGSLALMDSEAFARFDDAAELDQGGDHCASQTTHGYTDIKVGTQIVVKDEGGNILATGLTVGGEVPGGGTYDSERDACIWAFSVDDLQEAEFYAIEVGRRGGPTYSRADLEAQDWVVDLTIGD